MRFIRKVWQTLKRHNLAMEAGGYTYDLDAFVERIGYDGPLEPSLETLAGLQLCHVCSIPFETLSLLLGEAVPLDPSALEDKLIKRRRGGYCFEQNGLMLGILRQIGFEVKPLAGRVRIGRPRDVLPPRTHMFLMVQIHGGPWIYDAGVGSASPTSPLRFELGAEQTSRHDTRRFIREGGIYFHQIRLDGEWTDVCEFTGEEMPEIDREVSNWWTSTNPNCRLGQSLMASRALPNGERMAILNDRFTRRNGSEVLESIEIPSADDLISVLADRFGLVFPPGTRFGQGPKPWPTE